MFTIGPPAEVIGALEVWIGAFKQGGCFLKKAEGVLVGDVGIEFLVVGIEPGDVLLEFGDKG